MAYQENLNRFKTLKNHSALALNAIIELQKEQERELIMLAEKRNIPVETLKERFCFWVDHPQQTFQRLFPVSVTKLLNIDIRVGTKQQRCYYFPILYHENTIVGFNTYNPPWEDPDKVKYILSIPNFLGKPDLTLSMNRIVHAYKENCCIIIEGAFDSFRLDTVGLLNNQALIGQYISKPLLHILSRFDRIVVIPDNVKEGQQNHRKKTVDRLQKQFSDKTLCTVLWIPRTVVVDEKEIFIKDVDDYLNSSKVGDLYPQHKNTLLAAYRKAATQPKFKQAEIFL